MRTPFTLITALLLSANTPAAPLTLSEVPLYLGSNAAPNILFLLDDSGSMDWEIMSRDHANGGRFTGTQPDGTSPPGSGAVRHRDGNYDGVADCGFWSGSFNGYVYGVEFGANTYADNDNDCNTADDRAWRFRNSDFNPLYFDPTKAYPAWSGVDINGNPFTDIDITNAPDDPYNPGDRIDLTLESSNWLGGTDHDDRGGFRYYTWSDADGDGLFDDGEETEHLIATAPADIQQNFANWFSYYRSREYVAKAAYGRVIAAAGNVRMGLVTLHNNHGVNTAVAQMNAAPAGGAKRALLDALYSFHSSGGTPLRGSSYNCGRYLECKSNSFFTGCPALAEADGGNCQQNFMVVMTDGFYNGNFSGLGNRDGDNDSAWDGGAFADTRDNTLADIAMHFYERDLFPGVADELPVSLGIDEARHQHAVTYSVAFGVDGQLSAMPADEATPFAWPDPFTSQAARIDDLRHAAYNGRGLFLSAGNPDELSRALLDAMGDIGDRTSSAAAVALNSGALNDGSRLYQARFDSGDWSGQLLAFALNSDGSVGARLWDAGERLASQHWNLGRSIISYAPNLGRGIPFRWAELEAEQRQWLDDDPATAALDSDGKGAARLDYLRGDRSLEGAGGMRVRGRVLADIVHSAPVYFGPNSVFHYPRDLEAQDYPAYVASRSTQPGMVYVGANDGMLHAFAVEDGRELLAYVPSMLYPRLGGYTDSGYRHRYFVDGQINVVDAYIGNRWRSVLVGGLRVGGQGVYALDVSDPSSFGEANAANLALWEFSDADDADMGNSFGRASIVKLNDGRWAAVFGNGYNNSGSGNAVLFILDLADGTLIAKIDTGVGVADDPHGQGRPNGLSAPSLVDVDGDQRVDSAYAGDLFGNLWKFDLSGNTPSQWKVALGNPANPAPLFQARIMMPWGERTQPITTQPELGRHPSGKGVMIYFGSGQYMVEGDHTTVDTDAQSFYALWDDDSGAIGRAQLLQQSIRRETLLLGGAELRVTSSEAIDWSLHRGWFMDLYNTAGGSLGVESNGGERQVSNPLLRRDRIIFTTLIPDGEVCGHGGSGWLMELDAHSGASLAVVPFDSNGDGVIDDNDQVSAAPGDFADADTNGDGSLDADEFAALGGADEFAAADTNGDGRIDEQEYAAYIEQLGLVPGGIRSQEGIMPQPAIIADGELEYKYASGSTGAIDTVTESAEGDFGRQSWRRLK